MPRDPCKLDWGQPLCRKRSPSDRDQVCLANHTKIFEQEMNEMSGSRGEANFVWKCKNCKVACLSCNGHHAFPTMLPWSDKMQRESSASIKAAPVPYDRSEPPKPHKILEFDCRGLEFTEFKPEVRSKVIAYYDLRIRILTSSRANGYRKGKNRVHPSVLLIWSMASGSTTTRRPARRSVSRMSNGRSSVHKCIGGLPN
jgi:hypothetical protein